MLSYSGLPWWLSGKESAAGAGDTGSILWRRKWQPTPVFLPGKSHGQRSLVGYSPWGHKESEHAQMSPLNFCLHFKI